MIRADILAASDNTYRVGHNTCRRDDSDSRDNNGKINTCLRIETSDYGAFGPQ